MASDRAIADMILKLKYSYPGKFESDEDGVSVELWYKHLKSFGDQIVSVATDHLIRKNKWPPSISEMIEQCYQLSNGRTRAITGEDSWPRVLKWAREPRESIEGIELTDLEKKALDASSLVSSDIAQAPDYYTMNQNKRQFCNAYDRISSEQREARLILPELKALLGETDTQKELLGKSEEYGSKVMSFTEAQKEFGSAMDNLKKIWNE